jgi:hypothetical protein
MVKHSTSMPACFVAALGIVVLLAGCGGGSTPTEPIEPQAYGTVSLRIHWPDAVQAQEITPDTDMIHIRCSRADGHTVELSAFKDEVGPDGILDKKLMLLAGNWHIHAHTLRLGAFRVIQALTGHGGTDLDIVAWQLNNADIEVTPLVSDATNWDTMPPGLRFLIYSALEDGNPDTFALEATGDTHWTLAVQHTDPYVYPWADVTPTELTSGVVASGVTDPITVTYSPYSLTGALNFAVLNLCSDDYTQIQIGIMGTAGALLPVVNITEPDPGANVSGDFDVTVEATARTPGATIARIDVFVNGMTQTVHGAAGTLTFDTLQLENGANTIIAVATDSNGMIAQTTCDITVDNVVSDFTVSVQNATVAAGANVTVPIVMSDTTGVAGFGMTINYDQTKLELVGGDAAIVKGAAVPAGALLQLNTATPGVILVAVAGTTNFNAAEQQILTIEFKAIGAAGPTVVDIDDTAGAPTPFNFADAMATSLDPQPAAVDGTVTIQ